VTLPASPTVGSEVTLVDSQNYFGSNNLTIISTSEKILSSAGNLVLNTNSQAITLVYVNATVGWTYKTNSES
jgi:hypothetical protein